MEKQVARILVIDDDELVAKAILALLQSAGHSAVVAANGRDALRSLGQGLYDLVITDIFMPEVEGLETIRQIRRSGSAVPIIAMSGGPRATIMASAIDAVDHLEVARLLGADRAVSKPITRAKLLPVIDECLGAASTPGTAC